MTDISNISDISNNNDYTKTDINGIPARYILAKDPNDPTGDTSIVTKVIDTDALSTQTQTQSLNKRPPILNPLYNFSQTPLHLQDQSKLIIQHRLGDHNLPYRRIDPSLYTSEELRWYIRGEIPANPMSICMTYAKKCYLCGDFQDHEDLMCFESSGQHPFGYKFCKDCEPYFRRDMYGRLWLSCIWELRVMYEEWHASMKQPSSEPRPFIWVNRTRRDEDGNRDIVSKCPYKYTKWYIINWVPRKFPIPHYDEITNEIIKNDEYGLIVEQIDDGEQNIIGDECITLTKIVPLYDILVINFDVTNIDTTKTTDTTKYKLKNLNEYDPNEDDPLNKYTYAEKIEFMHKARKIEMP